MRTLLSWLIGGLWILGITACQSGDNRNTPDVELAEVAAEDTLAEPDGEAMRLARMEQWKGDFEGMRERKRIRALVPYGKTFYFFDGATRRGLILDAMRLFEEEINSGRSPADRIGIVFILVERDELIPGLIRGYGDIAAGNLTITDTREETVDFTDPFVTGVRELVVTGPSAPPLKDLTDLAGKSIFVRPSSSYFESLRRLSDSLQQEGLAPISIRPADENLEDEDILEMVHAGLYPFTVVDHYMAEFWSQIYDKLEVRDDLVVASGRSIGWAVRKNSPELKAELNRFVKTHRKGTFLGNVLIQRYLRDTDWAENVLAESEQEKFLKLAGYFNKYGKQYGINWLLIAAHAYQESKFNQKLVSSAGAVGIMQIKPSTARDRNINIPHVERAEDNIHAGVKYMRFLADQYYADAPMDSLNKALFVIASYNAGPARIAGLRKKAEARGLDPNRWFHNVELIAAEEIGRETVQYVSNIYKYYLSYRQLATLLRERGEVPEEFDV